MSFVQLRRIFRKMDDLALLIKHHYKEYKTQLAHLSDGLASFGQFYGYHPITHEPVKRRRLTRVPFDSIELDLRTLMNRESGIDEPNIDAFTAKLPQLILRDHRIIATCMIMLSSDEVAKQILQLNNTELLIEWSLDAIREADFSFLDILLQVLASQMEFRGTNAAIRLSMQISRAAQHAPISKEYSESIAEHSHALSQKLTRTLKRPLHKPSRAESKADNESANTNTSTNTNASTVRGKGITPTAARSTEGYNRAKLNTQQVPISKKAIEAQRAPMHRQPKKLSKFSNVARVATPATTSTAVSSGPSFLDQMLKRPRLIAPTGEIGLLAPPSLPPPPPPPSLESSRRKLKWADEVGRPLIRDDEPLPKYYLLWRDGVDESEAEAKGSNTVEPPSTATKDLKLLMKEERKNERERMAQERLNRQQQLQEMKPQVAWKRPARITPEGSETIAARSQEYRTQGVRLRQLTEVVYTDSAAIPQDPSLHHSITNPANQIEFTRRPVDIPFETFEALPEFLRVLPQHILTRIVENEELLQSCLLPNGSFDEQRLQQRVAEVIAQSST